MLRFGPSRLQRYEEVCAAEQSRSLMLLQLFYLLLPGHNFSALRSYRGSDKPPEIQNNRAEVFS
jgi:hypothetical protein